jgi:hypothetical protein
VITLPEFLIALFICALVFPIDYAITRWMRRKKEKSIDRELEKLFADEQS